MAKSWLWISPDGAGLGLVRELMKRGHSVHILAAGNSSFYKGFTCIGQGQPIDVRISLAIKMAQQGKFDYAVVDMIGKLPRAVEAYGYKITSVGQLAQILSAYVRGINVFPFAAAAEALELQREDGVNIAAAVGMKVPSTKQFTRISEGIQFIKENPNHLVFKPHDNIIGTYVGHSPADIIFYMTELQKEHGDKITYILQEFIEGVEVDIEGWFVNGNYIEGTANITLETKKFMPGDMGIMTGCATTVQKVVSESSPLFKKALQRYFNILKRWFYTGAFSVTTIVSRKDKEPYFLENCARMGWTAMYALLELYNRDVEGFFIDILEQKFKGFSSGFGYGVRVSLPPYPFEAVSPKEQQAFKVLVENAVKKVYVYGEKAAKAAGGFVWWCDVAPTGSFVGAEPVYEATGTGVCEVTASHPTDILKAQEKAEAAVKSLVGRNLQARLGDGGEIARQRFQTLQNWGIIITKEREKT